MDMTRFLEWLEDMIDPYLKGKKAEIWPIDDGMMVDLVEKTMMSVFKAQFN